MSPSPRQDAPSRAAAAASPAGLAILESLLGGAAPAAAVVEALGLEAALRR